MRKDKVCLVIGANGFVGSHLVDSLSRRSGVYVRAFDRFSRKPQFNESDNIEIVTGDIYEDTDLRTAIVGVDYVLHSFSATTPFISDNNPFIDISSNLTRSVSIFDICADEGVEKVGFISSGGAVYGRVAEHGEAHEDSAPLPVSPYGINKLAIEHYLEYFKRKRGLDYVAYRLTNPYGPRQVTKNSQGVIPIFLQRMRHDEEILIYGDGTSSRDYIHAVDAAEMVIGSFLNKTKQSVYNIGSGDQTSLNDIVRDLEALYGRKAKVAYSDAPKTFLRSTAVSIDRYVAEFGQPSLRTMHEGLKEILS